MKLLTHPETGREKQLREYPDRVVATRVYSAVTWQEQLTGLIGKKIDPEEALCLYGCRQVHTAFLRYPIDVAFLDDSHCDHPCVVHQETLSPWRISRYVANATCVVEMRAGSLLATLKPGTRLDFL